MAFCSNVLLSVVLVAAFVSLVSADTESDVKNTLDDAGKIRGSTLACGFPPTTCSDGSFIHYYKCCGGVADLSDCCFRLQTWAYIVLGIIAIIVIASVILAIVRCVCCAR